MAPPTTDTAASSPPLSPPPDLEPASSDAAPLAPRTTRIPSDPLTNPGASHPSTSGDTRRKNGGKAGTRTDTSTSVEALAAAAGFQDIDTDNHIDASTSSHRDLGRMGQHIAAAIPSRQTEFSYNPDDRDNAMTPAAGAGAGLGTSAGTEAMGEIDVDAALAKAEQDADAPGSPTARVMRALAPNQALQGEAKWAPVSNEPTSGPRRWRAKGGEGVQVWQVAGGSGTHLLVVNTDDLATA